MKTALITGITGQDASYLAEFLLTKDYNVVGMFRHSSTKTFDKIANIIDDIQLVGGDLTDQTSLVNIVDTFQPDEVYNLASQSFVPVSWKQPHLTGEVTGLGVLNVLEAIKTVNSKIKFYQASSSEMFGKIRECPQNENTPFHPRSPYGVAKVYGHWITVNYRESYDMFACSGILFNHESPRRGLNFVTRKITDGAAKIKLGLESNLALGNLDSKRDWGFAGDYIKAMWLMLQQAKPDDYVVGSEEAHSIQEFCDAAFSYFDLDYKDFVIKDPRFMRPAEVDLLISDASKAREVLGWQPDTSFTQLVEMMCKTDYERLLNAH